MDGFLKVLLLILLIIYVRAPMDLMPGPVDDLLMMIAYAVFNKAAAKRAE